EQRQRNYVVNYCINQVKRLAQREDSCPLTQLQPLNNEFLVDESYSACPVIFAYHPFRLGCQVRREWMHPLVGLSLIPNHQMFSYRQGSKGFLPTLLALFLSVRVTTLPSSGAFENLPLTDHLMLKEARKKVVTCNYSATGQQVIMDRQSPTLSKETTYHQRSIEHLGQAGGIDTDNFPLNNTLGSQRYLPHSSETSISFTG
ncbi:hypothetical protein BDFG_04490, partial [Blastomyces dermatitidis ATCC 26199]